MYMCAHAAIFPSNDIHNVKSKGVSTIEAIDAAASVIFANGLIMNSYRISSKNSAPLIIWHLYKIMENSSNFGKGCHAYML